jgi:hypothetical protein
MIKMLRLRAELHAHSNLSDGMDSVRRMLEAAVEKNLDVISITDHDTVNGSLEAVEIVEEEHLPIKVLVGVEITTSSGHLLAYGIERDVDPKMSMRESCDTVRKLGGICFLAHPFDFIRGGSIRIGDFRAVDGVEVFNAKSYVNFLAKKFALKYSKPGIAGSDAHSARSVGTAVSFLNPDGELLKSLFKASFEAKKVPLGERIRFLKAHLPILRDREP